MQKEFSIKDILKKYVKPVVANKYLFVLVLFGVWITFFDENNLISRYKYDRKIRKISQEINYYEKEIEQSKRKMLELKSNRENLEKFAREQYLMKAPDEEIFIIE
jgi:cell division protein FtsB